MLKTPLTNVYNDFHQIMMLVRNEGSHLGRGIEDREREALFAAMGLTVVRFRNEEILQDLPAVLKRLANLKT